MALQRDPAIVLGFVEEARSYLPTIREGVVRYLADEQLAAEIDAAYRLTHTIAGAASMVGLDDWEFPERWTMVDGERVVTMFEQLIPGADGTTYRQAGISVLYYAGNGKFSYEMDLMNMAHVNQDLKSAEWMPKGDFNMPPRIPVRDYSRPDGSAF